MVCGSDRLGTGSLRHARRPRQIHDFRHSALRRRRLHNAVSHVLKCLHNTIRHADNHPDDLGHYGGSRAGRVGGDAVRLDRRQSGRRSVH